MTEQVAVVFLGLVVVFGTIGSVLMFIYLNNEVERSHRRLQKLAESLGYDVYTHGVGVRWGDDEKQPIRREEFEERMKELSSATTDRFGAVAEHLKVKFTTNRTPAQPEIRKVVLEKR